MSSLLTALFIGSAAAVSIHGPARLSAVQTSARLAVGPRCQAEAPAGPLTDVFGKFPSVKCQGNTLKTWDLGDEGIERVQLSLKNGGRPIHTNVELWHTPSYVPTKFSIYTESGVARPVDVRDSV